MMPEQYRPTWLDLPVSTFASRIDDTPDGVTTLRRISSRTHHRPIIEQIRAEADEERQKLLKNQLRAIAPVAFLRHRKKDTSFEDKLISQWPLLACDIDRHDNPTHDMIELKKLICAMPYVVLCSFSVRSGIWFVVRLPDEQNPDSLSAHFRYMQRLFVERFDVILDASKGSNPTSLRYVTWDSSPYLNDAPTVMHRTYTPPPPKRYTVPVSEVVDEDEAELIRRLLMPVEAAGDGERHAALLKASRVVGGLSAANRVNEEVAISALEAVASGWPDFGKSQRTIRDGVRHGSNEPIYPETRPAYSPRPTPVKSPAPHAYRGNRLQSFDVPTKPQPSEPLADTIVVEVDSRPRLIQADGSIVYGDVLDFVTPNDYPVEWDAPNEVAEEIAQAEPSAVVYAPPKPIDLARLDWKLLVRPPLAWDRIEAHRALMACILPIGAVEDSPVLKRLTDLSWKDYVRPPRFYIDRRLQIPFGIL